MMSVLKFIGVVCIVFGAAGAAQAVDDVRLAASDAPHAVRRHAPPSAEQARNDEGMQALCREVFVDTDEGYGVTNRESRVICDESR